CRPFAAFVTIFVSTWHIWPSAVQTGDAFYHLANAHDVAFMVRHHQDPLGRLPQVFGTPVFRFYQSLLALCVGTLQAWTDLPLEFLYSIFVIVPFMLSPFAYHYFLRSLGLRPWT